MAGREGAEERQLRALLVWPAGEYRDHMRGEILRRLHLETRAAPTILHDAFDGHRAR